MAAVASAAAQQAGRRAGAAAAAAEKNTPRSSEQAVSEALQLMRDGIEDLSGSLVRVALDMLREHSAVSRAATELYADGRRPMSIMLAVADKRINAGLTVRILRQAWLGESATRKRMRDNASDIGVVLVNQLRLLPNESEMLLLVDLEIANVLSAAIRAGSAAADAFRVPAAVLAEAASLLAVEATAELLESAPLRRSLADGSLAPVAYRGATRTVGEVAIEAADVAIAELGAVASVLTKALPSAVDLESKAQRRAVALIELLHKTGGMPLGDSMLLRAAELALPIVVAYLLTGNNNDSISASGKRAALQAARGASKAAKRNRFDRTIAALQNAGGSGGSGAGAATSTVRSDISASNAHQRRRCDRCLVAAASYQCAHCKAVYYCSARCQRRDWCVGTHNTACTL